MIDFAAYIVAPFIFPVMSFQLTVPTSTAIHGKLYECTSFYEAFGIEKSCYEAEEIGGKDY